MELYYYSVYNIFGAPFTARVTLKAVFIFVVTFVIMYFICLFSVGIPFLTLELTVGQVSGGICDYWGFCRLFRGLMYMIFWINVFGAIPFLGRTSRMVVYLMYCFELYIPWIKCRLPWATQSK